MFLIIVLVLLNIFQIYAMQDVKIIKLLTLFKNYSYVNFSNAQFMGDNKIIARISYETGLYSIDLNNLYASPKDLANIPDLKLWIYKKNLPLLYTDGQGNLNQFDFEDEKSQKIADAINADVYKIYSSSDGKYAGLITRGTKQIKICDTRTKQPITYNWPIKYPYSIDLIINDDHHIAIVTDILEEYHCSNNMYIFDLAVSTSKPFYDKTPLVSTIATSNNGNKIFTSTYHKKLNTIDTLSGNIVNKCNIDSNAIGISADDRYLAIADKDQQIYVAEVNSSHIKLKTVILKNNIPPEYTFCNPCNLAINEDHNTLLFHIGSQAFIATFPHIDERQNQEYRDEVVKKYASGNVAKKLMYREIQHK